MIKTLNSSDALDETGCGWKCEKDDDLFLIVSLSATAPVPVFPINRGPIQLGAALGGGGGGWGAASWYSGTNANIGGGVR